MQTTDGYFRNSHNFKILFAINLRTIYKMFVILNCIQQPKLFNPSHTHYHQLCIDLLNYIITACIFFFPFFFIKKSTFYRRLKF